MKSTFGYTIRWITLLLVGVLLLAMLVGFLVVTNATFIRLLEEYERESSALQGSAATRLLNATLERLPAATRDWSSWDETYDFVKFRNTGFEEKLTDYPMQLYGLNFAILLDTDGKLIYRYDYNYLEKHESEAIYDINELHKSLSELTLSTFTPGMASDVSNTMQFGCSGFVSNKGSLYYISAFPILQSDETGPPEGVFIFGRQILASEWQDMILLEGATLDLLSQRAAILTSNEVYNGSDPVVFVDDANHRITSFTPIMDIFGKYSTSLLLSQRRDLYDSGVLMLRLLMLIVFLAGAAVAAVIVITLERIVLRPLTSLSGALRDVGTDESRRVSGKFNGLEIRSLQDAINDMLARLELRSNELVMNNTTLSVYSRALETTADAIILFDGDYQLEYINPAARSELECMEDDLIGMPFNELIFSGHDSPEWSAIRLAMKNGSAYMGELTIAHRNGEKAVYEATITPIMNDGGVAHITAILRNITQKKQYEEMLIYVAEHDALTDLPNRIYFSRALKRAIEECEKDSERLAIAHMNINGFKYVNDALGYEAGDELLCAVAKRLSESCDGLSLVAHTGGDEFLLLIRSVESEEHLELIAKRIFQSLEAPYNLNNHEYMISVSLGSSVYPDDDIDAETLLRNADLAMHRAKTMGGNHFESYYDGLADEISQRLNVGMSLRKAIERKELVPFFQPIVDAQTGRVSSCEALVRWLSPTDGMISPMRFIPLATETGLIVPITEMMLTESLKSARRFHEMGYRIVVAVNVPVQVLLHMDFMSMVETALLESGMEPRYLNIEITEDTLVLDSEAALSRLEWLRSKNIGISVDDFGTGYSSLSYLKRLSPQRVKIDQWFIGGIPGDSENVAIVNAILALTRGLGLATTAEGVETLEQWQYLQKHGCTYLQGYFFMRPVPEDQFIKFLTENGPPDEALYQ